jgi:hypothetical protein
MPKRIPPSHQIKSIEKAMPRANTRNEHPKCEDCPEPAEFTIEAVSASGSGYLDLCSVHLEDRLATEPNFSARMIAGLIRDKLGSTQRDQEKQKVAS